MSAEHVKLIEDFKREREAALLRRPSREEAEKAVRTLIQWAGDDPDREGLLGTPDRVVRSYEEFFAGYTEDPVAILVHGASAGVDRDPSRRAGAFVVTIGDSVAVGIMFLAQ